MKAETFFTNRNFFTPAFRIKLENSDLSRELISDVLEISFTDDLENIDSFEFNLHDWDPIKLLPKYSSPWDESGTPLKLSEGGSDVPNFEPGATVSLFMGYLEDGELPLIMEGEVISLAPTFPASGTPTCRVRALNKFLRGMQKIRIDKHMDGTAKDIVDTLCRDNNITVQWAASLQEGTPEKKVALEGTLYDEIANRAKEYGLTIGTIEEPGSNPVLSLLQPSDSGDQSVADFIWGRTLISFMPVLSIAGQVSKVIAKCSDPSQDGEKMNISSEKTWSDINLSPSAIGSPNASDSKDALSEIIEVIKLDNTSTQEDADKAAEARLRELAATLITGTGSSIGLPALRAGKLIKITGMGVRFDGIYRLTQTTHTIGGSGYITNFQARKEVLNNG